MPRVGKQNAMQTFIKCQPILLHFLLSPECHFGVPAVCCCASVTHWAELVQYSTLIGENNCDQEKKKKKPI